MKVPRSEGASPQVRAQMDRFVEGLLMGLGSTQAAVFAGVSSQAAARQGQKWRVDPYVRGRFAKLREKLTRDEICSFAELALNVKSIAFDESTEDVVDHWYKDEPQLVTKRTVKHSDRLAASALLAKLMGHEAPAKLSTTVNGGLLLLPVADSMDQWEAQAMAAQARLQQEVEKDAVEKDADV